MSWDTLTLQIHNDDLNCETYAAIILGCNLCEFFITCDAVCGQSRYKNIVIKVTFLPRVH